MTQSKFKRLTIEGKCGYCGEWAYPYSLCHRCRITANIRRILRHFSKMGWVDVTVDANDKRQKIFKWNNTGPQEFKHRKLSPEAVARMSLPRLNGKPMTDEVIGDAILDILKTNGFPMTEKEIDKGFKSLKTNNKIIPLKEDLISEYKLIQSKASNLSKSQRDAVNTRIAFLLKQGVITQEQLSI